MHRLDRMHRVVTVATRRLETKFSTEFVEKGTFRNNITFADVCDINGTCPPFGNSSFKRLNITFKRPNPDATIKFADNNGVLGSTQQEVRIKLISPKGKVSYVIVDTSGQIYVQ